MLVYQRVHLNFFGNIGFPFLNHHDCGNSQTGKNWLDNFPISSSHLKFKKTHLRINATEVFSSRMEISPKPYIQIGLHLFRFSWFVGHSHFWNFQGVLKKTGCIKNPSPSFRLVLERGIQSKPNLGSRSTHPGCSSCFLAHSLQKGLQWCWSHA